MNKKLRSKRKLRTKRKIRGGGPHTRGERSNTGRNFSYKSRISKSRISKRKNRFNNLRGRAALQKLPSDLAKFINSLLNKDDLPDSGPNLEFRLGPIPSLYSKAKIKVHSALVSIWNFIKKNTDKLKSSMISFVEQHEKLERLLNMGKYTILYAKMIVAYLPTQRLPFGSLGMVKPEPREYNDKIEEYTKKIEDIEQKMNALKMSHGSVLPEPAHKYGYSNQLSGEGLSGSKHVGDTYQTLTDELTRIIEEMNNYIDQNCSIIYATDVENPPPPPLPVTDSNVQHLVRTFSDPVIGSTTGSNPAFGSLKKKKKKKKKKSTKKKKKTSKK